MDKFRQILIGDYRRIYEYSILQVCHWRHMVGTYPAGDVRLYNEKIRGYLAVARSARHALLDMGVKP